METTNKKSLKKYNQLTELVGTIVILRYQDGRKIVSAHRGTLRQSDSGSFQVGLNFIDVTAVMADTTRFIDCDDIKIKGSIITVQY